MKPIIIYPGRSDFLVAELKERDWHLAGKTVRLSRARDRRLTLMDFAERRFRVIPPEEVIARLLEREP